MNTTVQLHEIIANALDISTELVNDELEYQSIVEWDSMSHLLLVEELEATYKISIETEDILEMNNVSKIMEVLRKRGVGII